MLTGLFAGSGAIALAAPDTQDDSTGSNSQATNPGLSRKSPISSDSVGNIAVHAGKSTANGAGKPLPGRGRHSSVSTPSTAASSSTTATDSSAATDSTDPSSYSGSTKGPGASAVANLPDAAPADASAATVINSAVQTAEAISSAVRQPPATSVPSTTTTLVPLSMPAGTPGTGPLGGVLAPLGNLVENVADALGTGQIIQPFMDVANHLLEGVSAPASNSIPARDSRQVRLPVVLPVQPMPELQVSQAAPVLPGVSLINPAKATAPAEAPAAMTPRLLSNQVNFSASQPPAVSPATPPVAQNWISGIATQIFHGVREALRNVTLTELAWAALPGVAGLVFFFATGIGLGHRQAKFGFVMATSGSVRFAVRGPLGVVRSGSVVAVHSRKKARGSEAALAGETTGTTANGRRHLRLVENAA